MCKLAYPSSGTTAKLCQSLQTWKLSRAPWLIGADVVIFLPDVRLDHPKGLILQWIRKRGNVTAGVHTQYLICANDVRKPWVCVPLTLSLGWSAEVLSIQGMDTVAFTQLDVAISQIVCAGQQWSWSPQHSACGHSRGRNILTTKVVKRLSHWLIQARDFIWLIK